MRLPSSIELSITTAIMPLERTGQTVKLRKKQGRTLLDTVAPCLFPCPHALPGDIGGVLSRPRVRGRRGGAAWHERRLTHAQLCARIFQNCSCIRGVLNV